MSKDIFDCANNAGNDKDAESIDRTDDTDEERFRPYRVDLEPNLFSLMRQIRGYDYEDALDLRRGRSLFWPGCSLSSYSEKLTAAVSSFLTERGQTDGMSVHCCGNILYYMGDPDLYRDYTDRLKAKLIEQGVTRIIAGCPNCYRTLTTLLKHTPEVEVVDLPTVLERVRGTYNLTPPSTLSYCIHDSCPDRKLHVFGPAVRRLFEGVELREAEHNQEHSRCCGLGKLRFINNPEKSERLRSKRIKEFRETGADQLVTYCLSCANALQDPETDLKAVHYLELLFSIPVDWDAAYTSSEQAFDLISTAP